MWSLVNTVWLLSSGFFEFWFGCCDVWWASWCLKLTVGKKDTRLHTQSPTHIEIRAVPIVIERLARPHTVNAGTSLASPSVHHIPCLMNLFFDSTSKSAFLKFRLSIVTSQQ
jgi:hypothetical protein